MERDKEKIVRDWSEIWKKNKRLSFLPKFWDEKKKIYFSFKTILPWKVYIFVKMYFKVHFQD